MPFANALFSGIAYTEEYFDSSISLMPSDHKIELNATDGCLDEISSSTSNEKLNVFDLKWVENCLKWDYRRLDIKIFDNNGRLHGSFNEIENDFCLNEIELASGIYFVHCYERNTNHFQIIKIVLP